MQNLISYFKRWIEEDQPAQDQTRPYKVPPHIPPPTASPSQWYTNRPSKIETQELHKHIDLAG